MSLPLRRPTLSSPLAALVLVVAAAIALVTLTGPAQAQVSPGDFADELRVAGFDRSLALEWLPDGRALVLGQGGQIWVADAAAGTKSLYLTIPDVDDNGERGALDLVFDPGFAANGRVYVFYMSDSNDRFNIGRFTYTGAGSSDVNSLTVVWSVPDTNPGTSHSGGSLDFGADGHLYLSVGDGTDASRSQDLTNVFGKILRIAKDGSVPAGNPFDDGGGPNVDEIYAYGVRNPWRGSFDDVTGTYYFGDVGGNNPTTAYEEINVLAAGANYGWPSCEGPLGPPKAGPSCPAGVTAPLWSYLHFAAEGCCAAVGGEVVRGATVPDELDGAYLYADFNQEQIRYLELGAGNTVTDEGVVKTGTRQVVWLGQGPDGHVYYLRYGYQPGQGELHRLRYTPGADQPPVIHSATANPTTGPAPLSVSFTGNASDPDGDPVSYRWDFGDGTTSTQKNPTHIYTAAGNFQAQLRVTAGGQTTVGSLIGIDVGQAPVASIDAPADGSRFSAGDSIVLDGSATDDGPLADGDFRWDVWLIHDQHLHPELTAFGRQASFDVATSGHGWEGDTGLRIQLTVTDDLGLIDTDAVEIVPRKVPVQIRSDAGSGVTIDGVAQLTPFDLDTVAGFRHVVATEPDVCDGARRWLFDRWSDGSVAPSRVFVVPTSAVTLTARYNDAGPCQVTCLGIPATVVIGAGDLPTAGDDVIVGTAGSDVIDARGGDDLVCGGDGDDQIDGGAGADWLFGDAGIDRIAGGIDADVLDGGTGGDHLLGNDGNDVLLGRGGNDVLNGGPGADRLHGRGGDDVLRGGIGEDLLWGEAGADDLFGGGEGDHLRGGDGADRLAGAYGNDRAEGGPGNDEIKGSPGADDLYGDGGDDRLAGEAGDDVLRGGAGSDRCLGGAGLDATWACELVSGVP